MIISGVLGILWHFLERRYLFCPNWIALPSKYIKSLTSHESDVGRKNGICPGSVMMSQLRSEFSMFGKDHAIHYGQRVMRTRGTDSSAERGTLFFKLGKYCCLGPVIVRFLQRKEGWVGGTE